MLPLIDQVFVVYSLVLISLLLLIKCLTLVWNLVKTESNAQYYYIDAINQCLPQTQCGQCGYQGCRPYAKAISTGEATNKCPPGGNETIIKLAHLCNEPYQKLNAAHGKLSPFSVAVIREAECIGCTKCIVACPVDAILGGPKLMHTVIESECTGCDLCIEPCPVDCIDMISPTDNKKSWLLPSQAGLLAQQAESV